MQRLAPQIDRLFVAGHRAAAPYAAPWRQELGIPHLGVLIDLRKLLLAPEGVTLEQARVMERYADPAGIAATLEEHARQGFLRRQGGAFLPTKRGRQILYRLTEALQRAVTSLWSGQDRAVAEAVDLAAVVVRGAATLSPADYPAFALERRGFVPANAGPSFLLWTHLSSLRYLREEVYPPHLAASLWRVAQGIRRSV